MSDSDYEETTLSAHTLAALQEFLFEQEEQERKLRDAHHLQDESKDVTITENWELSQFWYDDKTAEILAKEAIYAAGSNGRIACISAPTAYRKIKELKPETCDVICLEFDERFKVFGKDFVFYDYKEPLKLAPELREQFDVVIADPPFLSEECLTKMALSMKYLSKKNLILCTGAIMEDLAQKLLKLKTCKVQPRHANGLQNKLLFYTNYSTKYLDVTET